MIALLWGRLQGTVAAIALVVGAIFSAWIVGRKTGGERVRAQAAAHEQEVRGRQMKQLALLSVLVLLTACGTVASRPCPRVTEFPTELQRRAAEELARAPALARMMDAMAVDRAFNREICK